MQEKENKKSPPSTDDSPQQNEQLNNPSTDESNVPTAETTPEVEPPSTLNPQPSTIEEMEVHHHAHDPAAPHHKKNWKSYFWEFLMLFLAVFCGFLAEYQLEQTIERHREKEFIISMIEDAATDTANIHIAIAQNTERIKHAGNLAMAALHYKGTKAENVSIYSATRKTVYYPELAHPTDRTLFQLKNSGGMRLIRNKKAVESIITYDKIGKNVVNQQVYYEHYLTVLTEASSQMLDFSVLLNYKQPSAIYLENDARLVNPTVEKLLEIGNMSMMFQGVMMQYIARLEEMEKQAIELINTLNKEYHLK